MMHVLKHGPIVKQVASGLLIERYVFWSGVYLIILSLLFLGLSFIDQRLLALELIWHKPTKFALSFGLNLLTLRIFMLWLSEQQKQRTGFRVIAWVVLVSSWFEVVYIALQAALGEESHYNMSTLHDAVMYGLMGVAAVSLVVGSGCIGAWLWRNSEVHPDRLFMRSTGAAVMLGSFLTLILAGYMSTTGSSFVNHENIELTYLLPVLSWSMEVGDLRVPHFFATHIMQVIPFVSYCLLKYAKGSQTHVVGAIVLVTLVYLVVTAWVSWQAFSGQPFIMHARLA